MPSEVVTCGVCGEDCWLSKYSGDATLALALQHSESGQIVITCSICFEAVLRLQNLSSAEFHVHRNSGGDL